MFVVESSVSVVSLLSGSFVLRVSNVGRNNSGSTSPACPGGVQLSAIRTASSRAVSAAEVAGFAMIDVGRRRTTSLTPSNPILTSSSYEREIRQELKLGSSTFCPLDDEEPAAGGRFMGINRLETKDNWLVV